MILKLLLQNMRDYSGTSALMGFEKLYIYCKDTSMIRILALRGKRRMTEERDLAKAFESPKRRTCLVERIIV